MGRVILLIASILLTGTYGEPQEYDREVSPLTSLREQQAQPPLYNAQPSYGGYNPYPSYPNYGGYNPYPYNQMPGSSYYPGYNPGYPSWGYPNYGYQATAPESSTTKPNYDPDEVQGSTGVEIIDGLSNPQPANNNGMNWNYPQYTQPGLNWNPNGFQYGQPNWQKSYTPMQGGCYNRCRPQCGYRPPPPPPPPPPPRPRPIPLPQPMPQPPKPSYGCRSVCRPMCNARPTCGMGAGSEFNGNTMVCGRPNYNQGYGNNWNSWNYGGMVNPAPAQPQLKVASPTETEDTNDESET